MNQVEALQAFKEGVPSDSESVHEILNSSLFEPIGDLFGRPSKNLRASLVQAGYLFARGPAKGETVCGRLADALEAIHAGSLIIDDIQDGSRERRGAPSLHEKYGMPLALNAGNYLYFQPFAWIESLELPERIELRLYRLCHEAMLNAHVGQAIDLGANIAVVPRMQVESICRNSSRFKTGSLTALALACGAAAAGASDQLVDALKIFGENFGVALQRFDDIGNLNLDEDDPKRFEDLRLRRPSWAWALAARLEPSLTHSHDSHYRAFVAAAGALPDDDLISIWLERENFFAFAQKENEKFLADCLSAVPGSSDDARKILHGLGEKLRSSYGTQVIRQN